MISGLPLLWVGSGRSSFRAISLSQQSGVPQLISFSTWLGDNTQRSSI